MRCTLIALSFGAFFLLYTAYSHADSFEHKGQVSFWGGYNDNVDGQSGIRYIPEISASKKLNEKLIIDAEVSLNLYSFTTFDSIKELEDRAEAKMYRSWARLSGDRFEARVGLQRINFGPAQILRSLQWFDQLDARDPLELTSGVYALLGRYYFQNNSNIWIWGLFENDGLKGLETLKSDKDSPEFGGRYQFPVSKGEMAFTYHNRRIDRDWWSKNESGEISGGLENRYAIDGSFDLGIGLWFEAVVSDIKKNSHESILTKYLTVGADYTFDIGPGVHVLGEHFIKSSGSKMFKTDSEDMTSAISADFSSGVLDTVTLIGYYDWQQDRFYPNVSWQRAYDNWFINATGFYNSSAVGSVYSGTGILCTIAFNY
ncbi:MAG: hypothetical protein KKH34_07185 [Candidatus Omnitrophica bacterium]|nr:hypothetical protein [Candidatus Omnitrophota bacterium]